MNKLTEHKTIRFSKNQIKTFEILKNHGVQIDRFIRQAIKEKIQRDWKGIKIEHEKIKIPF